MKKIIFILVVILAGCTTDLSVEESIESDDLIIESSSVETMSNENSDMFTSRDLEQTVSDVDEVYVLNSNEELMITEAGTYSVSGNVVNSTIIVDVDSEDKVQIELDNLTIINEEAPAIYVLSADKVFITISGDNYLEVNGTKVDGETNVDAVIFSKDDLVLNGEGTLEIEGYSNGITSKDDLKITGGDISILASEDGLEANDSIRISGGTLTLSVGKDALHSENEEDETLGYIYISGGILNINAGDDAIRGNSYIQIDGGTINVYTSYEGIEATQVIINDGDIDIYASDDGINATKKVNDTVEIIINGGYVAVEVGSGDTDAVDSNGNFEINGGVLDITTPGSSLDVDGSSIMNGGTVLVNGEEVTDLSSLSQMSPRKH